MISSKDILAKLLATENLTVTHDKVKTASFDVKKRVLTLPIWDDMEGFTYDHLVGHEVGHALYTPEEGWRDAVSDNSPAYKSYLNVIEDARIEKLIQRKYPGLRREFVKSYNKMLKDGFFGDDVEGINQYNLIDRINTYFKLGRSSGVRIEPEEMVWVEEIEAATTWDQVVDIADRMYTKATEDATNKEDEVQELMSMEFDDDTKPEPEKFEFDEMSEFDDSGMFEDETEEVEVEGYGDSVTDEFNDESVEDTIGSKTDEALRNRIESELGDTHQGDVYNLTNKYYNRTTVKGLTIGYKEILEDFSNMNETYRNHDRPVFGMLSRAEEHGDDLLNSFMKNNKKTIKYLVKEFEMKKSASAYSRATTSKTGVIDPVLLNSYRYSDDIFKKVTNIPEGKNHGMIMYLDWSGSMAHDLFNTVEQTLNLVHFCRQVQIPFRVYAFTNRYHKTENYDEILSSTEQLNLVPESSFQLLEFFNNKMNGRQITRMSKILLTLANHIGQVRSEYALGGTPLDTTLTMAPVIYDMFQEENRVDIVNTIFLTDGDSHMSHFAYKDRFDRPMPMSISRVAISYVQSDTVISITDPVTKKRYRVNNAKFTKTLLEMYSDRTKSNVIGFRIMPQGRSQVSWVFDKCGVGSLAIFDMLKELKKENYTTIPGQGYTKFFAIKGGAGLKTANGSFEVATDAKKGQITSAFKKANKSKLVSRTMLNEFIKEIA